MAVPTRAVTAARCASGVPAAPGGASAGRAAAPAATVLGILRLAGQRRNVSLARAFVASRLGAGHPCLDEAVLLCSELVTNAVLHTGSGQPGGVVMVTLLDVGDGVQLEVTDEGSAAVPVVRDEVFASDGHGLFLVEQLAAGWGYRRDGQVTTVWCRLAG
jgi:anti-sigma regulatory factor (Ser/Thr protein kinase)